MVTRVIRVIEFIRVIRVIEFIRVIRVIRAYSQTFDTWKAQFWTEIRFKLNSFLRQHRNFPGLQFAREKLML
jgi:hypothetical protein